LELHCAGIKCTLALKCPDLIQMDKKGKRALLCKSALHMTLACKNL